MRGHSWVATAIAGVVVGALGFVQGCGATPSAGFDSTGDDAGGGPASGGSVASGTGSSLLDDASSIITGDGRAIGGCKAGHYTGTFAGTYSSFLTFVGVPIPVTGDVELTLEQSAGGGEFQYVISNGTVSGTADGILAQYQCDIVGTLDCSTRTLVGGGLRNCTYCVGAFADDAGTCLGAAGHFEGPLTADYDVVTSSFVNGTWNGSEQIADDGGIPDGAISDAGYGGLANYGGSGTWTAQYSP